MTKQIHALIRYTNNLAERAAIDSAWLRYIAVNLEKELFSSGIAASLIFGFVQGVYTAQQISREEIIEFEHFLKANGFDYLLVPKETN